jgi:hypothetical protein
VPASRVGASTSAVAVGDGTHRITFTASDLRAETEIIVRVDGADASDGRSIAAGEMTATAAGSRFEWMIEWSDGSSVELWWAQGWFLGLTVPAERGSHLVGLLSAPNHDMHDDLRLPDGTIVAARDPQRIDLDFAPAWRVDERTTLFDYNPGESPRTFVGPPAAAGVILPSDEAFAACAEAVGDGAASFERDACAYDVTVTGSSTFVFDYHRAAQAREDARTPPLAPMSPAGEDRSPATPAGADGSLLVLSGTLFGGSAPAADPSAVRELTGTVTLAEGTVLVATTDSCGPDTNSLFRVTHRESGALAATAVCDAQGMNRAMAGPDDEAVNGEAYIWASQGGVYDISLTTDETEPSLTTVELFADSTPTIVPSSEYMSDGYRGSVSGIGDTIVLLADTGDESSSWTTTGLDRVCAIIAYGGGPLGERGSTGLGICGHPQVVAIGPSGGQVVPVVVFSRTPATTHIEFTR